MEKHMGDTIDEVSTSSASSSDSLSFPTKVPQIELNRSISKPIIFAWHPNDFTEDLLEKPSSQSVLFEDSSDKRLPYF
jgi:hypothetical protein